MFGFTAPAPLAGAFFLDARSAAHQPLICFSIREKLVSLAHVDWAHVFFQRDAIVRAIISHLKEFRGLMPLRRECPLWEVVSTGRRNTLSQGEKIESVGR